MWSLTDSIFCVKFDKWLQKQKKCFMSSNTHSARCKTKTAVQISPPLSIWITIWQFSVTTLFCLFIVDIVVFWPLTVKPHPTQQDGMCITTLYPPSPGVPGWLGRKDTTIMDEDLIAFFMLVFKVEWKRWWRSHWSVELWICLGHICQCPSYE